MLKVGILMYTYKAILKFFCAYYDFGDDVYKKFSQLSIVQGEMRMSSNNYHSIHINFLYNSHTRCHWRVFGRICYYINKRTLLIFLNAFTSLCKKKQKL